MAASQLWKSGIGLVLRRAAASKWPIFNSAAVSASARKGVHSSAYDKNPDEHVRPGLVPDEVVEGQSRNSWSPNPTTGVFGPADGHVPPETSPPSSVLDQKAWFRPLEDVDKPPAHPHP